ncbi:MAG: hypothetical protein U5R06_10600 [candidate division KSB1 bacterium]|nr:hypothetical protein [candidate division KSB1 bacterium]
MTLFDEPEKQIMARLSRWVAHGKLLRLRRGKYMLPVPYQKEMASLFYISNYLYRPSFISLFSALQHYQCIPEHVQAIQAVTTRQTKVWNTQVGRFQYFSTHSERFFGYERVKLGPGLQQTALIATLERALVDICYFYSGEWTQNRWTELRLDLPDFFQRERLLGYADRMQSKKVLRSVHALLKLVNKKQ